MEKVLMDIADPRETTPRLPRVELEILRGRARNKRRRVDVPVFLIGSARDCDLVLADADFPDVHTYLYVNRGGVSVRRLGEGPVLVVDGREVHSSTIVDGQKLQIGCYEFAVRIEDSTGSGRRDDDVEQAETQEKSPAPTEPAGVALVRALLDDIRAALRIESNLQLYTERELPWRTITAGDTLLVRKASA
jgi:predicted component of type VI protein secretion system